MLEKKKASAGDLSPSSRKRVKINESRNMEYGISINSQPKGVFQRRNHQSDEEGDADEEDLEPLNKKRNKSFKADVYESDEEIEGPDSDEDTDEEGEEAKKRQGKVPANDDEDEDMFGDDSAVPTKKKLQFLKSNDIEGQEWSTLDNINEEDGEIPTESFNMDQELAEGNFTQSGVYIRKKDEQSIHDSWLKGIGKKDIEKAKMAHQALLKKEKEAEMNQKQIDPNQSLFEIFKLLQPSETILNAIKRLGAGSTTLPKWKKVKKNTNKGAKELTSEEIAENKKNLDLITSLATSLIDTNASIYEMTYQDIALHLQSRKLI